MNELIQTEMDLNTGEPKDDLAEETLKWANSLGSKAKSLKEVLSTKDEIVSL